MGLNDCLCNKQPQTNSCVLTIFNIVDAIEPFKNVVKRFWVYANTLINNLDQVFFIFFLQFYLHLFARRRELDCIIQNITKDLSYTKLICNDSAIMRLNIEINCMLFSTYPR